MHCCIVKRGLAGILVGCDDHNAGTTWINFVWNAPTGYSDFEVTFDGETEPISRNSYFASGLNGGTPYRFSVKTEASRREVEFGCERYR